MRSLLDFIVRHSYVFLFVLLETLALVLLFGFNDRQRVAFMTSAGTLSGTLLEWRSGVGGYFGLRQENERLVLENARLHDLLYAYKKGAIKQIEDSLSSQSTIVARVIDNSVRKDDNYITIDRGVTDGVMPEMGVYDSHGVVGVVMVAGEHYSVVLPLLNGKTSISCKIMGTDSFGFLEWPGGDPYRAQLMDFPYHASVKRGDTLVTSGFSQVFPEGMVVGVVDEVKRGVKGKSPVVSVSLAAHMADLGWVYINPKAADQEIRELVQQTVE